MQASNIQTKNENKGLRIGYYASGYRTVTVLHNVSADWILTVVGKGLILFSAPFYLNIYKVDRNRSTVAIGNQGTWFPGTCLNEPIYIFAIQIWVEVQRNLRAFSAG